MKTTGTPRILAWVIRIGFPRATGSGGAAGAFSSNRNESLILHTPVEYPLKERQVLIDDSPICSTQLPIVNRVAYDRKSVRNWTPPW